MAKESLQKKITRVRPPRVHITYDVETGGAIEKRDIPFVVGVLADLSGVPEQPLPPLKDRKFVEIDKDNFDRVLGQVNPRLAFKVDNRLSEDDSRLGVELRFQSMADFEPAAPGLDLAPRQESGMRSAMRWQLSERKQNFARPASGRWLHFRRA